MNRIFLVRLSACLALSSGATFAADDAWRLGVDSLRVEAGAISGQQGDTNFYSLTGSPFVAWQPATRWELRAQAKLFAMGESRSGASYRVDGIEPQDTYLRFRHEDTRLTLGYQSVVWSRVDEISTIDRVSRVDLSSSLANPVAERRLAHPGLRWEQTSGDFKLDTVAIWPQDGALLPDARSRWFPIDQATGRVLGLQATPELSAFVKTATLNSSKPAGPGLAMRLTRDDGLGLTWGATLGRTPAALPHFEVNVQKGELTATYPRVGFVGLDAEFANDNAIWRGEVSWSHDAPYTANNGARLALGTLDWVAGVEFFPGGEETRVSLQLAGRRVAGSQTILQVREQLTLNGEVATSFARATWTAALRFNLGLRQRDVYLAPRISYVGLEPYVFYFGAQIFSGENNTLGGYYKAQDLINFGIKTRF